MNPALAVGERRGVRGRASHRAAEHADLSQAAVAAEDSAIRSRIVAVRAEPTRRANIAAPPRREGSAARRKHLGVLHRPHEVGDRLSRGAEGRDGLRRPDLPRPA